MILHISCELDSSAVDMLTLAYNSLPENETLILYINCQGGEIPASEAIIDMINMNKDITELYGYGVLCSCAFEVFFKVECKKGLIGGVLGMYHQAIMDIQINEKTKSKEKIDGCKKKYLKNYIYPNTIEFCKKLKMSDQEIKEIKRGNDVWFEPERMYKFLM